jgi:hypothetical protein
MRSLKKLRMLTIVVFALSAVGAANASAAQFTYSATGTITGNALETQSFTFNGGSVQCKQALSSGTINSTASSQQELTVTYSSCIAFGFATVDIPPATYLFTASGSVHLQNTITITPTFSGSSLCTLTIGPQTMGTIDFANSGASNIKVSPTVSGIVYTSTKGVCGEPGSNGTYTGASELSRVGGGSIRYHP